MNSEKSKLVDSFAIGGEALLPAERNKANKNENFDIITWVIFQAREFYKTTKHQYKSQADS